MSTRPPAREEADQVAVRTLGGLSVFRGQVPLGGPWLEQRPGDLLALLVAERGRAIAAEEVAETLWPDRGAAALGTVHHFVSVLRDRLEPDRPRGNPAGAIETVGRGYRLGGRVIVDADRFAAHAAAGVEAWRARARSRALRELSAAEALYGGPFLGERAEPWIVLLERERLRALAADVWRALIELAQEVGDLEAAERHLARLAEQEPYDDDVGRHAVSLAAKRDQTRQSEISSPSNGQQIEPT
jgi:DNA-binding SARP family transcriptional activator